MNLPEKINGSRKLARALRETVAQILDLPADREEVKVSDLALAIRLAGGIDGLVSRVPVCQAERSTLWAYLDGLRRQSLIDDEAAVIIKIGPGTLTIEVCCIPIDAVVSCDGRVQMLVAEKELKIYLAPHTD